MTIQVRIATKGTVTDEHYGLLDFGFLTITDNNDQSELKLDASQYHIEADNVIVTFDESRLWNKQDKPIESTIDWQYIKEQGKRFDVSLFCGFADDIEGEAPKIAYYGEPQLEYETGSMPIQLDNDITN